MDDLSVGILRDFHEVMSRLGLRYVLVGAGARLLAVRRMQREGRAVRDARATLDWDFGVQLESAGAYQAACSALTDCAFAKEASWQRFRHTASGIKLDLVPFGSIAADGKLEMEDGGGQMHVLGFEEALVRAWRFDIGGQEIPVVDDVGFAILKFVAWFDRREIKDLKDVWHLMRHYDSPGNTERMWNRYAESLTDGVLTHDVASARLLGVDMGLTMAPPTRAVVETVLELLSDAQGMFLKPLALLEQPLDEIAHVFWEVLGGVREAKE